MKNTKTWKPYIPLLLLAASLATTAYGTDDPDKIGKIAKKDGEFSNNSQDKEVQIAESWLALADAGKYNECFNQLSEFYKEKTTSKKFEHDMSEYRKSLGKPLHRIFDSRLTLVNRSWKRTHLSPELITSVRIRQFETEGETNLVTFYTTFANGKNMEEGVLLVKGKGNVWKVASYGCVERKDPKKGHEK